MFEFLKKRLSKVPRSISAADIRFGIPSLSAHCPYDPTQPAEPDWPSIHEDDWRQIEFLDEQAAEFVLSQFSSIARIVEQSDGNGFWEVHMRPDPQQALKDRNVQLPKFTVGDWQPLAIGGHRSNGTTCVIDPSGWMVYAETSNTHTLKALGIEPGRKPLSEQMAREVAALSNSNNLLLVDWYSRSFVDCSEITELLTWANRYTH